MTASKKEAIKYYELAVKQSFAPAQFYLGLKNDIGDGVDKNEKRAIELYKLSAAQGFKNAQSILSRKGKIDNFEPNLQ